MLKYYWEHKRAIFYFIVSGILFMVLSVLAMVTKTNTSNTPAGVVFSVLVWTPIILGINQLRLENSNKSRIKSFIYGILVLGISVAVFGASIVIVYQLIF